jgi:hypothetical protein
MQELVNKHNKSLELLSAIEYFRVRTERLKEEANRYALIGLNGVAERSAHKSIIANMAKERLTKVYNNLNSK